MIQSMTGFGSAAEDAFKVEVRSVNHRFMDVSMKIPQNLGRHEMPLRDLIKERFTRGRFDVLVTVSRAGAAGVKINMDSAWALHESLLALKGQLSLSGDIGIDTIVGFKDLLLSEEIEYDSGPLYTAFHEALSGLEEMRLREGETIARDMSSRLDMVGQMISEVASLCPEAVSACRTRFVERLHALFGEAQYDESRVLQEASIMAERTDVTEEITRFNSHISQTRKVLSGGDVAGRKIEFLLQELNREVNTIASKANDYRISNLTVELKAELEKMREQAQNIQ